MTTKIQIRRATLAAFIAANVILAMGEPAYTTDTKDYRIGDGVTAFADLAVFSKKSDLTAILENQAIINDNQAQINDEQGIINDAQAELILNVQGHNTNINILTNSVNEAFNRIIPLESRVLAIENIPPLSVIDGGTA